MAAYELKSGERFPPEPRQEDVVLARETASFQEFDQWMDVELERLVARWIHTAAPNAHRMSLLRGRSAHK